MWRLIRRDFAGQQPDGSWLVMAVYDVLPTIGRLHDLGSLCWCHPEVDDGLITHNVMH